jgi:hypothetical protein
MLEFIETNYNDIYRDIKEQKVISPDTEKKLREVLDEAIAKFNTSSEG